MTDTILSVKNLTLDIPTGSGMLHAVRGIDFDLNRGETLSIVGESGSGKSLTALAVIGLLGISIQRRADAMRFEEVDLLKANRRTLRNLRGNRVAMIFQEPMTSLNPAYMIGDQLIETLKLHRTVSTEMARQRALELLEKVGITAAESRLGQYPHQLSGGLRQRVMIALALMCEPDLLIADEPTTALDVSVQSQILNLLGELRREFGLTYLFISHDLAVIEHLATRVAVMYLGRIVEEASVADLFDRPRHPYTRALLGSVLTPDPTQGVPETALGTAYPNPIDPPSGCAFHPRCPLATAHCKTVGPRPLHSPTGRVECHLEDPESPLFKGDTA
ncbi:ABC transporter ATP-binding protein [Tropicimonas sp. TH_r6]|uniref:ABC transporter ATP-binding protein n=1 Tax=Tropicimonas sp. TH_r6 TaxID=3082085 RepID=UPI0029540B61|nr:ABC transporter ATP-binding protein [Tropicimonas sp. TH_r6]MDV7142055.1 ABC transporter ATP-binding protein [Tropicimonas sp. TH_r6]